VLLSVLNAEAGPRGLAVIPLEDEEGSLGLLAIESDADAAPLDDDSEELLGILANQTTVAIRNAELYQRVPMIGVLRPILGRGRLGGGAGRKKLALRLGGVAVVLTLAGVIPVPAWVPGDATIRPAELVPLRAATEGVISDILVKEGERVSTGAVVARLRNEEAAVTFEQVQAELSKARAEAARSRGHGDLASYQAKQTELAELVEREKYWRAELARAELTSPVNGVVLTPRVELQLGAKLARGERLLEMADLGALEAEVHVPQEEVNLLKPGSPARLKVHAYPSRTFKGRVTRVAPRADANRLFRVGVVLTNEDEALRPGMTGRAHIEVPPRPLLGTLLRPLVTWLRLKLWL
jgi:RND family efflux transporter MFP subunit